MATKVIQKSTTKDKNNCTVLALKSVTGWPETKCYTILKKMGRKDNKGFDIVSAIVNQDFSINGANFEPVIAVRDYYGTPLEIKATHGRYENTPTVRAFAKANPEGVFYVVVSSHALAIVNGVVVDNVLSGLGKQIKYAFRVSGAINPKTQKLDVVSTAKRLPRVKYGQPVKYIGKTIKSSKGVVVLKKGSLYKAERQHTSQPIVVINTLTHTVNVPRVEVEIVSSETFQKDVARKSKKYSDVTGQIVEYIGAPITFSLARGKYTVNPGDCLEIERQFIYAGTVRVYANPDASRYQMPYKGYCMLPLNREDVKLAETKSENNV